MHNKLFSIILLIATSQILLSCAPALEPAPDDVNGLAHWLWAHNEDGDDASIADAIDKVYDVLGFAQYSEDDRGLLRDLSSEELSVVNMQDRDPKPAQGMYLVNMYDCNLPKLEKHLYALNQGEMHSEVYESYEREYTSSFEDYSSRASKTLSWKFNYSAAPMPAAHYHTTGLGGLRYLADSEDLNLAHGPALLQTSWMDEPSVFDDTDANEFDLDFQIAVFFEPEPGRIAHFLAMWRHLAFNGVGADSEDSWVIDTILDGFVDWDTRVAEICAEP